MNFGETIPPVICRRAHLEAAQLCDCTPPPSLCTAPPHSKPHQRRRADLLSPVQRTSAAAAQAARNIADDRARQGRSPCSDHPPFCTSPHCRLHAGKTSRPSAAKPSRGQADAQPDAQNGSHPEEPAQQAHAADGGRGQAAGADEDPEYLSGEEDYADSDFEGRDGYRRGAPAPPPLPLTGGVQKPHTAAASVAVTCAAPGATVANRKQANLFY